MEYFTDKLVSVGVMAAIKSIYVNTIRRQWQSNMPGVTGGLDRPSFIV